MKFLAILQATLLLFGRCPTGCNNNVDQCVFTQQQLLFQTGVTGNTITANPAGSGATITGDEWGEGGFINYQGGTDADRLASIVPDPEDPTKIKKS